GTTEVSVGTQPTSVAIGDFNNDGKQDIAAANSGSDAVSIRLGDGLGGFSGTTEVSVGTYARSVAIGDFNNDGKQDFAAATAFGASVSIRLGDGSGGFSGTTNVSVGSNPYSVAIGDFNNDGKQDIAAANLSSNTVPIRLGNGDGTFTGATNVSVGSYPRSVAIGDFNSDGKQDLAVANQLSDTVSIRLGQCNLPPTIAAATGLSRQQGSTASNSQIATVTDDGGNGSVTVTVDGGASSTVNGVSVSNIANTGGNITADIVASCTATNATFTLQASDGSSTAADTLTVTVTANTAPVLTYASPQSVAFAGALNVTPTTASDNGTITGYAVQAGHGLTTAPTVDASGLVSITNAQPAGSHTITIRATDNCGSTTEAVFTLTVSKANQTITVGTHAPGSATYNASFTVAATSNSGLSVGYSSAGACTNVGALFTMTSSTGTCTVKYNQAGDSNYSAAPQVTETVNAQKANQTITFNALANRTFGDGDFNVSATATSGLAVSFTASGQCTISETLVHLTGAGSCTITAKQGGDSNYNAAPDVPQAFNIGKAATTAAVNSSANPSEFGQSVTFTAMVSSGAGTPTGTVQFKDGGTNLGSAQTLSAGGVAQLTISSLTSGTHSISAEYLGNDTWIGSTGTLQDGQVVKPQPTLSINDVSITEGNSGTTNLTFTVTLSAASNLTVSVKHDTADGVATTADNDYQLTSDTLTFNPGDSSLTKTVTVSITGDQKTEPDETVFVVLSNPVNAAFSDSQGTGTILNDDTLQLLLDTSGPDPNQLAALDSLLLIRDPFRVRNTATWFTSEQNTRVILFAENLQLNSGDSPSDVKINLIDGKGQPHEVPADDVRSIANTTVTQVIFRLPDLAEGTCLVTIKSHERISNTGTFRIAP
ncbi:MAG: beta strand repeat-containing protein, partial [Pyrinomonadaceae bacterium]